MNAMTRDELIQRAMEQLKGNNVTCGMLADPQVRDAAVVYFKIRPHSNCMLILDSQTGDRISGHFTTNPLLREYVDHCRLPMEADEIAKAVHSGDMDYFANDATQPAPPARAEMLEMLERRCPGWSGVDYERAFIAALSKS